MTKAQHSFHSHLKIPLGYLRACVQNNHLIRLDWQQHPFEEPVLEDHVSRETILQLKAYFNGELTEFNLPIDLSAYSEKQQRWWQILRSVPYGTRLSYSGLATLWGNPKAGRVAGNACKRNPIPIVIPCHRIINTNGQLHAYSGGDDLNPKSPENIQRKQWLIDFEASRKQPKL